VPPSNRACAVPSIEAGEPFPARSAMGPLGQPFAWLSDEWVI